jgi:hypothetical protein
LAASQLGFGKAIGYQIKWGYDDPAERYDLAGNRLNE